MSRETPVSEVMTTEVITYGAGENVGDVMEKMASSKVDAAPVVDEAGAVVGMVSTGDLIVSETELHVPTVISIFGATLELPSSKRHFEEDLRRALANTVADVMSTDVISVSSSETVEAAATRLHQHNVSRLPVIDDGVLVGIVSRIDIVRTMISDDAARTPEG